MRCTARRQKEIRMNPNAIRITLLASALGLVSLAAACSTWNSMTHQQEGTTVGASSGAMSGDVVRSAQQALTDRGYDATPIDGQFGPKTEEAVRRFQNANGIPPTGRLDSTTLSALNVSLS